MGSGSSAHAEHITEEVTAAVASKQADFTTCLDRLKKQQNERQKLEATLEAVAKELPDSTNQKDEVAALLADLACQTSVNVKAKEQVQAALSDLEEEIERLRQELVQKEKVINMQQEKLVQEEDKTAAEACKDIFDAARKGNAAAVRHFLRIDPDGVNHVNPNGEIALHLAARAGHTSVAELLLSAGAAVDAADIDGWTALHLAACYGRTGVVEKLLAAGAAIFANKKGKTALHLAAEYGRSPAVQQLLSTGAAVDAADKDGWTALHWAAENGHIDVTEKLIAASAALDATTTMGEKPYDLAKQRGRSEVMAVLNRVWVTLLSGRTCHCDPSQDRTISELKDEAESRLGLHIASLIGPDGKPLDEAKTLKEAEIQPGATLTAVVGPKVQDEEGLGDGEAAEVQDTQEPAELGEDHQGELHDPKRFIDFLITADVRLVRLEFLLELHQDGLAMPRRQEAETMRTKGGATALVELEEYRRLRVNEHSGHVSLDAGAGGQMVSVCFRSISHVWESMEHPDPWRNQLGEICAKYQDLPGTGLVWIFIDCMCLYQYKRNASQEISFQHALHMMHMLYSHELVQVDILEELTPESTKYEGTVLAYDEATDVMKLKSIFELRLNPTPHCLRGWCQAEKEWARLRNMVQGTGIPTPPELFRKRMTNMKFTHRNDAEQVFELQAKVFNAKVSGTTHLHLEDLTAKDLEALHDALPSYRHLKYVVVNGNALGGREAVALIESGAVDIQMESCDLTDEDAVMMAERLINAVSLKSLSLAGNRIGQRGLDALREVMQQRPELQITIQGQMPSESEAECRGFPMTGAGKQMKG